MFILSRLSRVVRSLPSLATIGLLTTLLILMAFLPLLSKASGQVRFASSTNLEFSATNVGASQAKTAIIKNEGRDAVSVQLLRRTNPYFDVTNEVFSLNPYQEKSLAISFTPDQVGVFRGEFVFGVLGRDETITLQVSGEAVKTGGVDTNTASNVFAGEFTVLDESVDFGNVYLRDSREDRVLVKNETVRAIRVVAELETEANFDLVNGNVIEVAPLAIAEVKLKFNPYKVGIKRNALSLRSGQFTEVVTLQGRGLANNASPDRNIASSLEIQHEATKAFNPSNLETAKIKFSLNNPAFVRVMIEQDGKIVRTLATGAEKLAAGTEHVQEFDGKKILRSEIMPAGRYRYVLEASNLADGLGTALAYGTINILSASNNIDLDVNAESGLQIQDLSANNEWRLKVNNDATVLILLTKNQEVLATIDRFYAKAGALFVRKLSMPEQFTTGEYDYTLVAVTADEESKVTGQIYKDNFGIRILNATNEPIVSEAEQLLSGLKYDRAFVETNQRQVTKAKFYLQEPAVVTAKVLNEKTGVVVDTIINSQKFAAGFHEEVASFRGVDQNGYKLAAGNYVIQFTASSTGERANLIDKDSVVVLVDNLSVAGTGNRDNLVTNFMVKRVNQVSDAYLNVAFDLNENAEVKIYAVDKDGRFLTYILPKRDLTAKTKRNFDWSGRDQYTDLFIGDRVASVRIDAKAKDSNYDDQDEATLSGAIRDKHMVTAVENLNPERKLTRAEAVSLLADLNLETSKYRAQDGNLGFVDLNTAQDAWLLNPFKTFLKTAWASRNTGGVILKEILEGYERSEILLPNEYVTQAEFYKLFVEGLNNQDFGTNLTIDRNPKTFCFSDIKVDKNSQWYLPYAKFVCDNLLTTEAYRFHSDGKFESSAPVTLDQATTVLKIGRERGWW